MTEPITDLEVFKRDHTEAYHKSLVIAAAWEEGRKRGLKPVKSWLNDSLQLKQSLDIASTATKWIPTEQARILELLEQAKNDSEREAREYQLWYVEQYLTRAENLAKERLQYFRNLDIAAERVKIASGDIVHWFKYYAWGYDPRARTPLSTVPFELFPKQKELVEWLTNKVFHRQDSGLIEKSRDEGATETIARFGLFHWLHTQGFSMLLSTRKEDEVDSKKNQNTLFERLRFQLRLLPRWQLPKGFDLERNMNTSMLLANPENGNTLLGEAPVENMGRGGRVTCAMLDEFAFWQFAGYPQYRSLSQTTPSLIIPSSVAGRLNQYADLAFDGITDKFVLDWRDNPMKDKRWYDSLPFGYISPKMSKTTIAQEVDRNYDAAQPGKVWQCPDAYAFITQDEFLLPFKEAKQDYKFFDDGKFRIPTDWRITRTHDYGKSDGHDWGYLLGAQPHERYVLHDTHFIFIGLNLEPTGLLIEQAVEQWRGYEQELGLRDKNGKWLEHEVLSWHSHEQDKLRDVLRESYGESWLAWDTDYETGIATIEDWWTIVDAEKPNPFRPQLKGRCKLVFVAPNGEYQLAFNERLNQWFTTTSQTERGFATLRKQISAYHYPQSELGKAVKAMRPKKEFDDIVDCLRGYSVNWNRKPAPLTYYEEFDKKLQKQTVFASELRDDTSIAAQISRAMAKAKVVKELQTEGWDIDDEGVEIDAPFESDLSGGW
jgi:hypothetical protein